MKKLIGLLVLIFVASISSLFAQKYDGTIDTHVKVKYFADLKGVSIPSDLDWRAFEFVKPRGKIVEIQKTKATQFLWTLMMGSNPCTSKGDNKPVYNVSYGDTQKFIAVLNMFETEYVLNHPGTVAYTYDLPTEKQWVSAAGVDVDPMVSSISDYAWPSDNVSDEIHAVAQLKANENGLYDVRGNVWEWTKESKDENEDKDLSRVLHGGSHFVEDVMFDRHCDSAIITGFRLVRTIKK